MLRVVGPHEGERVLEEVPPPGRWVGVEAPGAGRAVVLGGAHSPCAAAAAAAAAAARVGVERVRRVRRVAGVRQGGAESELGLGRVHHRHEPGPVGAKLALHQRE